jgi:hypothetical protein
MSRPTVLALIAEAATLAATASAFAATNGASLSDTHMAALRTTCLACHGADDAQGGFRLDTLPASIDTVEAADRWQKVMGVLNAGEMPPEDEPPLDPAVKTELLDDLAHALVVARKTLADAGGSITMRRLNRREYGNTLRDLLGVEVDVRELPADSGGTFDTVGSALFMSADQIEQYHEIGLQAIATAFKQFGRRQERRTLHKEPEVDINASLASHVNKTIHYHKQYHRWTKAVEAAARRPENQDVVAQLVAKQPDRLKALRHGWEQIAGAPPPTAFGFVDAVEADHNGSMWKSYGLYRTSYLTMPGTATGGYLGIRDVYVNENYTISLGGDWPPGRYVLRMRIAHTDEAPLQRRCIEYGWRHQLITIEGCREVTGTMEKPQILEIPLDVPDMPRGAIVIREKGLQDVDGKPHRVFAEGVQENGVGLEFAIWIDWVEVEGPFDTETVPPALVELVSVPDPGEPGGTKASAEQDIHGTFRRFAIRAFRGREPGDAYVDRLVAIFEKRRAAGMSFREAVKEPLAIILSSPHFLYLSEPMAPAASGDGTRRPLTDLELASRLAYFLTGGPPDDALLDRARAGGLAQPDMLAAEVNRLLADPKSRRFIDPFTHQWLGLDRLDFFQFNDTFYPDYDLATKALSRREIFETIALLVREDASLRQLLKSDFVVVNGILGRYYGLEDVVGDGFRKVNLPPNSPRGGLLGMAAVLAMGSNGEHSSPVERGAWVLRKVLHDPPPPAPPNVPQLARLDGQILTTRERMLMHQEQPQCASCHRRIDPLGYGMENFDAAGRWRTEDSYTKEGVGTKTWTIDPAGAIYGGPAFKDFFELRDIVATRIDAFAAGFTEALLEYALGRPYGFSDEQFRDAIVTRAASKDYSVREFIHAVVESDAFRSK